MVLTKLYPDICISISLASGNYILIVGFAHIGAPAVTWFFLVLIGIQVLRRLFEFALEFGTTC